MNELDMKTDADDSSVRTFMNMAEETIAKANQQRMKEVEEIRAIANELIETVNLLTGDPGRLSEAQQIVDTVNKLLATMNRRIHVANRLEGKLNQLKSEVSSGDKGDGELDLHTNRAIWLIRAAYLSVDELIQSERENPELANSSR
jgi:type I site-specific restriction-modification system R (restriction) subunit